MLHCKKQTLRGVLLTLAALCGGAARAEEPPRYAIAIHGGAGGLRADPAPVKAVLERALRTGGDLLRGGAASLDVVQQVVQLLEDAPEFNAGKGSVFTAEGRHELDASIMDGRDRSSGAVAGVRVAKNPVAVARLVMTQTRHALLAGGGADAFARSSGVELAPPEYFWTPRRRRQWRERNAPAPDNDAAAAVDNHPHYGTVGCVALDVHGNVAAATSTGGTAGKLPGRVGDSPLVGAGTWADNATCAVSCTGVGELFIRGNIAYDIAARQAYGKSGLAEAAHYHLHDSLAPGTGGVIAVGADGRIVLDFNTQAMPRGAADASGRFEVRVGR
ncbi:MAG: isoaspartyl peptidase/L-asparaginase [Planctomycetota bacterium]